MSISSMCGGGFLDIPLVFDIFGYVLETMSRKIMSTTYDDYINAQYEYDDEALGECDVCGRLIYPEDCHYKIEGDLVHYECLHEYADRRGWYEYGRD